METASSHTLFRDAIHMNAWKEGLRQPDANTLRGELRWRHDKARKEGGC